MPRSPAAAVLAALVLLGGAAAAQEAEDFETALIYLEQNTADRDAEVKLDVVGTGEGLASLRVTAPDGRDVVDFRAGGSKLGMRHFGLESPEPRNDGQVQADFPAGTYGFTATTASGKALRGEAVLSHAMPEAATLLRPRPDETGVAVTGLRLEWTPVQAASAWIVVIEQERTGREIRANLSGNATAFAVPDGFLLPGTDYKVAVGAVAKGGNRSFTETGFTTAINR